MNIKTKYSIGDKVFFMHDNSVREDRVRVVNVEVNSCYQDAKQVAEPARVKYVVTVYRTELTLHECELFSNRAALLRSL